eukprot:m.97129 g.97129  ORF g.97129 m.97129 type:complete len:194 (-) comp26951_c0_seq1:197-778(-)
MSGFVVRDRKRKKLEVVEFHDPTASMLRQNQTEKKGKRMFMSTNVSKVHGTVELPDEVADDGDPDDPSLIDIRITTQEVLKMGAAQMGANERRRWESQKLKGLGAKAGKTQKVPIGVLQGIRGKEMFREKKKIELEKETGMYNKNSKKATLSFTKPKGVSMSGKVGGRWVDNSNIEDKRMSTGMMRVNPRDIR